MIALALLVANEKNYCNTKNDIKKIWQADKILNGLEKINPNFYPIPLVEKENAKELIIRFNNY